MILGFTKMTGKEKYLTSSFVKITKQKT